MDYDAIKARQQKVWASGSYGEVAALIHPMSEHLVEAADLAPGARVLDVATGTGNAALAAARCHCAVTGVDYVPSLLDRARARAEAEGLPVDLVEGDAERLQFPDASFDAVLSVVGVMFAPDQERAAAELVRVCRPGGTVGLASWTPDGFIGDLFRIVSRHVPPPAGLRPPPLWGDEEHLQQLLGGAVTWLRVTRRTFVFRFPTPQALVDYFREHYGPTLKAFEALDEEKGRQLYADLTDLAARYSTSDSWCRVPSTYLEAVGTRN